MRLKWPRPTSLDEVRITRKGDIAVIEYADSGIRGVNVRFGPQLAAMTDADVLESFNAMLGAQAELATSVDRTLTEIPPGRPQIAYNDQSEQWVPRGQVVRCHIEDDEDGETVVDIDGEKLDLPAFGRMLRVYAGWGMRIAFVDEDDVTDEPEIVVRDPDDDVANGQ